MIWTLTGKNSFALQAELRSLITQVQDEVGDLGIERFDASEVDATTVLQAVQSLPFLVAKKLVVVSSLQSNAELLDRIAELVDRTADGVEVVLVEPALDKRKSSYRDLKKLTNLTEFNEPSPQELPGWLVAYAKEQGSTLSSQDASYLVERVGANQQQLAREVEKLALAGDITKESINALTEQSVQSTIFSLLDAAFSGNSERALAVYREQRRARVEPQYILVMLTWQLTNLTQAVYADPQTESTLITAGQSPFTARKSLQLAKH
ncbi:DNA polymerase III subunit delta, partial [Candidatus Saccharibacteria bacterium]|nr:DNA polymerase III subunit delta [Candidatus Saccharibacteria bacterium]